MLSHAKGYGVTSPPKMIERVARAICHEFNILHKPAYRLLSEAEQADECANGAELWENEARAAIAAMRINDVVYWVDGKPNASPSDIDWNARIDDALKEGQ